MNNLDNAQISWFFGKNGEVYQVVKGIKYVVTSLIINGKVIL